MQHYYWNDWYLSWGWFLWVAVMFLLFSGLGNWGYTYRAHQRFGALPSSRALDILKERYARGEVTREQYTAMRSEIAAP